MGGFASLSYEVSDFRETERLEHVEQILSHLPNSITAVCILHLSCW